MGNANKAKELDWWLSLGQANIYEWQDKTRRKYLTELEAMINDPLETASWKTAKLKPIELWQASMALAETIKTLRGGELDSVASSYTVKVSAVSLSGFQIFPTKADLWVDTEQDITTLVVAMLLRAIHEANLESNQIKECYCGNIFVQFGKREKVYCSKKCRTNAAIQRGEEEKAMADKNVKRRQQNED